MSTPPPRLHVELHGRGPALVLAHGFGGSARNFRSQARALGDRWRCVLYDARGHARSEAPESAGAYTPEALVADLGRVLDQTGAQSAVVGGLSMGAGSALGFALAQPARVRGLVLAAPPPARGAGAAGGGRNADWALAFADAIEREGLEAAGAEFVWGPRSGLDPAAARWVRQGFLEHAPHALAHLLRGVLARQRSVEELAPRLAALEVPVLVVVGARDTLSLGVARELAAHLPGARLAEIEGAGHVVNLAAPAAFNAALEAFLAELPRPARAERARES